jgi:hypothetical protein
MYINDDDVDWNNFINDIKVIDGDRSRKIYVPKKTLKNTFIIKPSNQQISLSGLIKNDKSDITLRRSNFSIDATLDLHGLNLLKAKDLFVRFIDNSFNKGYKYLLIKIMIITNILNYMV